MHLATFGTVKFRATVHRQDRYGFYKRDYISNYHIRNRPAYGEMTLALIHLSADFYILLNETPNKDYIQWSR